MRTTDNTTDLEIGTALVAALTNRDFQGMAALMSPRSRFRALLPSAVIDVDRNGGEVLAARLAGWFGGDDAFEVEDASVGRAGARIYLRWRVRMAAPGGPARELEQHVYLTVDGAIHQLDLMCSGWQAAREPVAP